MKTELSIFIIIIIGLMLTCPGCTLFWTDQALIVTWFKEIDANGAGVVVDPNSTRIGSGQSKTNNNSTEVWTPWGIMKSESK